SPCNIRVPSSLVLLSYFSHFLVEAIPFLDEVLDRNPAQLFFFPHLHTHSVLRRIIRRIVRAHADDLANAPISTANERIGQRLGFLEGHHTSSTAMSVSLPQAVGHCTIDAATLIAGFFGLGPLAALRRHGAALSPYFKQ